MTNRFICTLVFSCLLFPAAKAQNLVYARSVVDTLCSPEMHGRGYVQKGESLAAAYLASEFEKAGLKKFSGNYYQKFPISINTFPGAMQVKVNGQQLEAGKDYLCLPFSSAVDGKYKVMVIDKEIIEDQKKLLKLKKTDLSGKFILADSTGVKDEDWLKLFEGMKYNPLNAKGVIVLQHEKLTHGLSQGAYPFTTLEIKKSSLPSKVKTIELNIENKHFKKYKTQNIAGYVKGTQHPDSFIVISAHYDHLGRMGEPTYFPGANDNASGTAMLLDLAQHYSDNPPKYSIAFIAFGAEEAGILGSKYYTENPLFPLEQIKFLINMDIMGTGDEGITVVNGAVYQKEFEMLKALNKQEQFLAMVKKRGKAANSDHHWFTEKGIPAFFIYTMGGIKAYHDVYDRPETLPLTEYEDLFRLLSQYISLL